MIDYLLVELRSITSIDLSTYLPPYIPSMIDYLQIELLSTTILY